MKTLILIAALTAFCVPGFSLKLIYSVMNKTNSMETAITIEQTDSGYRVDTQSVKAGMMTEEMDNFFASGRWIYQNDKETTDILAERKNNEILISGKFKGKTVDLKHKVDDTPWFEEWSPGISRFALSGGINPYFWSISPSDINMIAKFKMTRLGNEKIHIGGQDVDSVHIKVGLTGLLEAFFSADYWCRKSDGRYIRSKIPEGPGGPMITTDLVKEE